MWRKNEKIRKKIIRKVRDINALFFEPVLWSFIPSPWSLHLFIGFFAPKISELYFGLDIVHSFWVFNFLELSNFVYSFIVNSIFSYFAQDLLPILFLKYCKFYFLSILIRFRFLFWYRETPWSFAWFDPLTMVDASFRPSSETLLSDHLLWEILDRLLRLKHKISIINS